MADNRSNTDQQSFRIDQKSIKNRPRGNQNQKKFDQNSTLEGFGGHLGPCVAPGADLTPKPWFVGPLGAPELGGPKRSKIDPRAVPKAINLVHIFGIDFRALLGSILIGFGGPKWSQNRSQIGLKSDHEGNAKLIQNYLLFNENGSPEGVEDQANIDEKLFRKRS